MSILRQAIYFAQALKEIRIDRQGDISAFCFLFDIISLEYYINNFGLTYFFTIKL